MLNTPLREAIAGLACAPASAPIHVVQVSSTGATGAVILHAWVGRECQARVVVKTPRDARLRHALAREWEVVQALHREPSLSQLIPAPLGTFVLGGATYFAYAGAPGRTMYSRFRNRILRSRHSLHRQFARQALSALVRVHGSRTRPADAAAVADDLLVDLAWLERTLVGLPAAVAGRGRTMAERIAATGRPLPVGRVHGDFSPYNVLMDGAGDDARVTLIDWEHSEDERPQHLDVFRFVAAGVLMGLREHARVAALRRTLEDDADVALGLLRPWLEAMHVAGAEAWTSPPAVEALWWHYLVHAARREQERRATPQDFSDSTYAPALASFASRAPGAATLATGTCAAT